MLAAGISISATAQEKFELGKPNNDAYRYLDQYKALKEYIDKEKYPNFKLGVGTTAADYNNKGLVYKLTNANFSETVAGNAMKMASCVSSSGSMNFNTVRNYVNNATAAGLSVYGHTLAWHSQQPIGWLTSLMKDKPAEVITDGDAYVYKTLIKKDFTTNQNVGWHSDYSQYNYNITFDKTNGMKVTNTKKASQNYEVQYIAMDNIAAEKGSTVKMIITLKGSADGTLFSKLGDWSSGPTSNIKFTTEWQTVEVTFSKTIGSSFLLLQSGSFVGDIYIKNIEFQSSVMGKTINEDRRCIAINADARVEGADDNQLFILTKKFSSGTTYEFTADVLANNTATVSTSIHRNPGKLAYENAIGEVSFTNNWQTVKVSGKFENSGASVAFNLSEFAGANTYYFDNISLKLNGEEQVENGSLDGTSTVSFKQKTARGDIEDVVISDKISYVYVPGTTKQTAEEIHDTLVYAMDKWIKGMMEACGGKVKAWDLVNEAISGGGDDGQGNYLLQHRDGYVAGANTWDVGGDAFFWQDYMGDLEYVRQACRLARKYGPEDVKLFINDYNLESTWDGNKKVKSLVGWIKKWEADGVTKIDGIGTQMHISYYLDKTSQENQQKCITNMFEIMAASGKLVRVSEMDMGLCDRQFGTAKKTSEITEEEHKLMADYYEWIIKEYLRIIPPAQQWGICQWCGTDAPSSSGWRGGEPVGIWDLNYYRKHAYAGFVRGLSGDSSTDIQQISDNKKIDASKGIYNINGMQLQANSLEELPSGLYIVDGKKVIK